mgnify:CR=1 FL=1
MPDRCDCGDPSCACCFPASYRQSREWEREQARMDRMTSAERVVPSAAPEPALPPTLAPGIPIPRFTLDQAQGAGDLKCELIREFGVGRRAIERILRGERWKHLSR